MLKIPARLLHETLLTAAEEGPERVAICEGKCSYTYGELHQTARQFAQALGARGFARGDRAVIYMDNGFLAVAALYGIAMAGGTFVVANPQTKAAKLAHILRDSASRFLITETRLAPQWQTACAEQPSLRGVLCQGEVGTFADLPVKSLADVLANSSAETLPQAGITLDLAALIYTSGSTGDPKGVMMTHQSMLFTVYSLLEYLRLDTDHRILLVLPLAFDYGLYQVLMSVAAQATLVIERSFTYAGQVLATVRANEVTVFPGVPTMYAMLIETHRKTPFSLPSVQRVTNTAAALPASYLPELRAIFPNALIFKMYGLTECKRVAYLEPELLDSHPKSVGKAIPGTELFLCSPSGEPVPAGEPGILHVRGPHVMQGYLNLPEATTRMLRPGKLPWEPVLCTGDWFRMDSEGFLYFVGRSDDIIKSRGEKVSPVEVENCLLAMPGVREVAAVGVPDEVLGQAIRVVLSVSEDGSIDARAVKRFCAARLENFMVPRDVIFVSALPKGDTGKINKLGLAELAMPGEV